ncbi:hypothetical protein LTR17_023649 [Elasticomyces elasticus]|nr:hypothetical protein LTR17_023649 [Elasticomyces elasticus]
MSYTTPAPLEPPESHASRRSVSTAAISILPTPPGTPSLPSRGVKAVPIRVTAPLSAISSSQPAGHDQASSQANATPAADATKSSPQRTARAAPSRSLAMLKADLRIVDWKCGAQTLRHTECQRSIVLRRRPLIDAQIASMTAMMCVDPSFPDALRELVMLVHCHQHDAGRPKDSRFEAWKLALAPTNSAPGELKLSVEQRIDELLGPLSAECLADVNGWTSYASHVANPWNSQGLIRAEISRPLAADDVHDGYVYAYGVEGNDGFIKIGYTRRPIVEQLHEWSFHCNRRTKLLYPSNAAIDPGGTPSDASVAELGTPTTLVPHARRLDALCHAELDHRRIRIYCNGCLKLHIEWFDVSAEEVIAIILKWSKWMATRPYKILSLKSRPKWVLKAGERQSLNRI